MINAQCWLVTGSGGSRIDFVAGWLGTLPGFVNNHWSIDATTGQSIGEMRLAKQLDYEVNYSVRNCLRDLGFNLTNDADLIYVGTCHGKYLQDQIQNDTVKILYIDIDGVDYKKICWEGLAKTYLTRPSINAKEDVDTDQIKQLFSKVRNLNCPPTPSALILDYTKLFQPGGSRYLCDCLQLTVDNRYHEYYDSQLVWADTPKEISALGQIWRYSDYF